MLTEPAGPWRTDSPWARLPWTVPTALLISAAVLWALAFLMEKPPGEQMKPIPVDARFIEEAVPQAPPVVARPAPPPPRPLPRPLPTPKEPPKNESAQQKPAAPSPNIALPTAPNEEETKSGIGQAGTVSGPPSTGAATGPSGPALAGSSAQTGSGAAKGSPGGGMLANTGAQAIVRPMPQIPDDLRQEAFSAKADVRFHIAADGSFEVELVRPMPNPRLNRILLDSLKKWRFMPAIKDGKPVASIEPFTFKFEVK